MFIVVNTISAAEPALTVMVEAFRKTAPDLRQFEGFLSFEIWREEGTLLAVSKWSSREAFMAYPRSDAFQRHHKGMTADQAGQTAQIKMYEGEVLL
ncbi:MAG TPA: antibiotic biosynthesis monooxygenase family protein [Polyangiaceae bacterium]|jgi:heme oxygenase (staphylobilin-producing)|nr:antibiotic biosynthesis monooxygenase family protein [Polyangiaceae bacterium]